MGQEEIRKLCARAAELEAEKAALEHEVIRIEKGNAVLREAAEELEDIDAGR